MMILGIPEKAPPLLTLYTYNAVAWLGTGVHLVRYEELVGSLDDLDGERGDRFSVRYSRLAGSNARTIGESASAWAPTANKAVRPGTISRESTMIPTELPQYLRKMIDFAAPGLRELLGYR